MKKCLNKSTDKTCIKCKTTLSEKELYAFSREANIDICFRCAHVVANHVSAFHGGVGELYDIKD